MLVPLLISCFPPCDLAGPDFREVAFSCGCVVRDVAAAQRLADRPQEDVNVIGEVDALHILSVELETLAPLEGVAPVDLREPGETGPHAMTESLAVVVVGRYSTRSGLGPMIAMSPLTMLNTSGSSSRLVERRARPNFVRRRSSGSRFPSASRSSVIVRNLYRLNTFSSRPGRGWRNSTGLPNFTRTRIATIASTHQKRMSRTRDRHRSMTRLPYR